MPGGDRTGPAGKGPMTGRAAGYCTGNTVLGYVNDVGGRGFRGRGRRGGGGRGWRNQFYATGLTGWQRAATGWPGFGRAVPQVVMPTVPDMSPEQQVNALKEQAKYFADTLDGIRRQIDEIEARAKKKE